jgi:hypothetical protein
MSRYYERWSKIEDNTLKDNLNKQVPHSEIAKLLNRSLDSVDNRIAYLGLCAVERKWTIEETQFLKQNYSKMKIQDIAKALKRTKSMISAKAHYIGLSKKITESQRKQVIDLAQKTTLTNEAIAHNTDMSLGSVNRIIRQSSIKRKIGARSTNPLLNGFHYQGTSSGSKHRYELLYAYHNTCWDCKKTFINENDLHIHHDLTKLPVQVLVLCKVCHGKRHNRNFHIGTRNN